MVGGGGVLMLMLIVVVASWQWSSSLGYLAGGAMLLGLGGWAWAGDTFSRRNRAGSCSAWASIR